MFTKKFLVLLLCSIGVFAIAYSYSADFVILRATNIANGSAYCIQVSESGKLGYKPASSKKSLGFPEMRAPFKQGGMDDFQFEFHAVLIVKTAGNPNWHNWSYRGLNFVPLSLEQRKRMINLLKPSCDPRPNFARDLPSE